MGLWSRLSAWLREKSMALSLDDLAKSPGSDGMAPIAGRAVRDRRLDHRGLLVIFVLVRLLTAF